MSGGDDGVARESYTWTMAVSDLALTTHLTMSQAFDLTYPVRDSSLHPYDALPLLRKLVNAQSDRGLADAGEAIYHLVMGKPRPMPWEVP